jgi:hypothetical protein
MWVQEWQAKKRARGLCPRCGDGKLDISKHTGEYYWLCKPCRLKQAAESRRYYEKKRASIPLAEQSQDCKKEQPHADILS